MAVANTAGLVKALTADTFNELAAKYPRARLPNPELTGCTIDGAWGQGLAGGCPKHGTWPKNPQFHLIPSRAAAVTIELCQEPGPDGKCFGIGFIVLKAEDERSAKTTVTKAEMVYYTRPFRASRRVETTLPLLEPRKAGLPYIVIPSTFDAHQETNFTISVTTEDVHCQFGWLGHAARVYIGERARVSQDLVPGGILGIVPGDIRGDGVDNEVKIENEGKALSKNTERELKAMVDDAITWCEANGRPFEDPDFPPEDRSLWGGAANTLKLPHVAFWARPHELPAVKEAGIPPSLFKARSEIEGVECGTPQLDNRWFISSCNIVAGNKECMERVFYYPKCPATKPTEDKHHGFYVVGFYQDDPHSDDDWKLVRVDDRIPCDDQGRPVFARCRSVEVYWVMIVEKAFAKLSGGYAHMQGGTVQAGLELLTGGLPTKYDLTDPETLSTLTRGTSRAGDMADAVQRIATLRQENALWTTMLEGLKSQPPQVVGCVFKTKSKADGRVVPRVEEITQRQKLGIQVDTVYCVTGCIKYDDVKLMRLRQLLGTDEWKGRWSDGDHNWTGNMRQMLNYADNADDGVFWMQYEDFVENFNKVYMCRMASDLFTRMTVRSRWEGFSAGGSPAFISWRSNNQWLLDITKRIKITVILSTEDPRRETGSGKRGIKTAIGFHVYRGNARQADRRRRRLVPDPADLVAKAEPRLVRKVVKNISLEPSKVPYVLVPHTANPGREAPFLLVLLSDDREDDGLPDLKFEPVRPATDWKTTTLKSEWHGESCGGPPNSVSFWDNPQFDLTLSKSSRVFIYLESVGVSQDTRDREGMESVAFPTIGFAVYQGVGPYCKLHAKETGKHMTQSKVQAADGVMMELQLDNLDGNPYIVIPFTTSEPTGPHAFYMTVYSDGKHIFAPVGKRPECPICERMEIVLKRLVEYEKQVDERLEHLESNRHILEHRPSPVRYG